MLSVYQQRMIALEAIGHLTAEAARIENERELAVAEALEKGAIWPQIGEALGVTTQAAHKRYRWLRWDLQRGLTWHERPLQQ